MNLLIFIAIIALLILGHELGHFVAARMAGVQVEEFGIGFPPRLLTLFEAGGTKFTLNLLPFGGFVRPVGEDDPEAPGGLAAASKRKRVAVLLAGPLANVALAILAFTIAYKFASPDFSKVMVAGVEPGSPAEQAGMLEGDLILAVQGQSVDSFKSLQTVVSQNLGKPVVLDLLREGKQISVELVPREQPPQGSGPIGIVLGYPTRSVPWPEALKLGATSTYVQFREIVLLPGRLLSGQIAPQEARVSGFKGMYDMLSWAGEIDRSTQRPFLTLNMVGLISVGLAIANLLPIPALDGGRLMFVAIEALLGRRLSPKYEGLAHAIGFLLLIMLMLYINLQDFVNPIVLPR